MNSKTAIERLLHALAAERLQVVRTYPRPGRVGTDDSPENSCSRHCHQCAHEPNGRDACSLVDQSRGEKSDAGTNPVEGSGIEGLSRCPPLPLEELVYVEYSDYH